LEVAAAAVHMAEAVEQLALVVAQAVQAFRRLEHQILVVVEEDLIQVVVLLVVLVLS
jgi:hypothetical protein